MGKVLALLTTLIGLSSMCGQTAAEYLVTVKEVRTTPSSDNGTPGVKEDVFFVKFKAILHNTSDHPIFISEEPVILTKAEILLPSGDWKTMLTSSWFDTGSQKYLQCTNLEPGYTFTFPMVNGNVVLGKDRPPNRTAIVRFYFYNMCMTGSARRSTGIVTERIEINQ